MPLPSMPKRQEAAPPDETQSAAAMVPPAPEENTISEQNPASASIRNVAAAVHPLIAQIKLIAKQFPEFADASGQAQQALMGGLLAIASKQRGTPPAGAPPMQ